MARLTLHFLDSEFSCPCCGQVAMNQDFMARLEALRLRWGKSFSPVDGGGYRCAIYRHSETDPHGEGVACDPGISRDDMHAFLKLAFEMGFRGVGAKQRDGRWQVHIDTASEIDGVRPRPWFWTY